MSTKHVPNAKCWDKRPSMCTLEAIGVGPLRPPQGEKCLEKQPWYMGNPSYIPVIPSHCTCTSPLLHGLRYPWTRAIWSGHPGAKKMVCTSLSKILTVSKNPQTNMFLLIVSQLRYPEVMLPLCYPELKSRPLLLIYQTVSQSLVWRLAPFLTLSEVCLIEVLKCWMAHRKGKTKSEVS